MREILFRGKSTGGIDKWIEGTGVFNDGINTWISFNEPNRAIAYGIKHRTVLPETVGQYTGLTDKNDKKIFEGDIISIPFEYDSFTSEVSTTCYENATVYFDVERLGWWVRFFDDQEICLWEYTDEDIVVIGNIHDNPELLNN